MPAHDIEIILSRQLADCLSLPVFITDIKGNLIFYNESAEEILGSRYEETGELKVEEWSTMFKPMNEKGKSMPPDDLPLVKTLKNKRPYHKAFFIESLSGVKRKISVTTYPIINRASKFVGAVAIFWVIKEE